MHAPLQRPGRQADAGPEPFLIGQQSDAMPRPVSQPAPTVAGSGAIALVEPFVLAPEGVHRGNAPRGTDQPLPTITAARGGGHVVQPYIIPQFASQEARDGQAPRTHSVDDPAPTVTGQGAGSLVEPYLVTVAHGQGEERRTHSLAGPLPTQTGSNTFGLATPFVVPVTHAGGEDRCHDLSAPMPTITGAHRGEHALVEPHLQKFYGTSTPASIDEPLDTVTAKDRFGLVQPTIRTADGQTFALDIHFRMLQPHELAGAMGFPADYQFTGNREARVKQIGNAVPVNLSKALIRALLESGVAR